MLIVDLTDAQILQLPDFCFGRKWPVIFSWYDKDALKFFMISTEVLPENCIIWEVVTSAQASYADRQEIGIALGAVLPANDAAYFALDKVIPSTATQVITLGEMAQWYQPNQHIIMKDLYKPAGRFFVVRILGSNLNRVREGNLSIVISSIPTRVPDWMISI